MRTQWPAWVGGGALATIIIGHWLLSGRMLAVSGRYSAIVNRLRRGREEDAAAAGPELIAAMEAATLLAFGEAALAEHATAQSTTPEAPPRRGLQSLAPQIVFLGCLIAGGFLSALLDGRFTLRLHLNSDLLPALFGRALGTQSLVLLGGGILVGVGTRLAGGCTSGHGLCGTSRFQIGSMIATAAFFGAGVVVSFALGGLLR